MQTCKTVVTSGEFQVGFCGTTAYDSLTSVTIPGEVTFGSSVTWSGSSAPLYAPLIQLNWKSSDLLPTSSQVSPTSRQDTAANSLITDFSPSPSSVPPQDSGLSSEGKIAVGVAVPLGVLAIAFLVAFLWFRQRRKSRFLSALPEEQRTGDKGGMYHDAGKSPGVQLDGKSAPQELAGKRYAPTPRHELVG